ncbi:hypothetical protein XIS1_530016 [Xenorhabdus innexi]|uniref:Uncharacterized protein n=1 Tax=Xenorhabdus innexi TaxID=290109 RepID=A0A1N6MZ67_9GAMM|nr:hypothetical protein Xinn_03744 [Xenorhabdus innexi]SIP74158.1 hypothetical protein XIS1_530016 [Xenorhabdus innexi]
MFLQWIKRAFIWVIKGIFNEIRGMASAFCVLGILVSGLELKFRLIFLALIAVLYSPEIWRLLKTRINNKNRR